MSFKFDNSIPKEQSYLLRQWTFLDLYPAPSPIALETNRDFQKQKKPHISLRLGIQNRIIVEPFY